MNTIYPLGEPGNSGNGPSLSSDRASNTRRAYSYQDHAAVTILASSIKTRQYAVLWIEHHDDILAVTPDGMIDIYQVKTDSAGDNKWTLKDGELQKAIKKFCLLEDLHGAKVRNYFIFSNIPAFLSSDHATDEDRKAESPILLIEKLRQLDYTALPKTLADAFNDFCKKIKQEPLLVQQVLRKISFRKGKGLENFRIEGISDIAPLDDRLARWTIADLRKIAKLLEDLVISASSIDVPPIQLHSSSYASTGIREAELEVRKVTLQDFESVIRQALARKKWKKNAAIVASLVLASTVLYAVRPSPGVRMVVAPIGLVNSGALTGA